MVLQSLLALAVLFGGHSAHANTIEGYTPAGQFATVGLDANKNFRVAISSIAFAVHVVVDGGTVTVKQAAGDVWNVTTSASAPLIVQVATAAVTISAQGTITTGAAQVFLPADAARKQGVVCNNEDIFGETTIIYLGPSSVDTSSGLPLQAGSCYSPDVPNAFIGDLYAASTATAHVSYVYHR